MATPFAELARSVIETQDNEEVPLPQPMPPDLKEKGWKMSRVDGTFRARNDRLGLYGTAVATPDDAINQARELDAGKKLISTGGKITFEEPVADFSPSDEEGKSATEEILDTAGEETPATKPEPLPPANNAVVPVERIRTDGGTQPRDEIDQSVVDRYAQDYRDGAIFPLIVVFNDGRNYWLADGFHRLFAFRNANPDAVYMTVDLRAGTQRDAVLYSLGANATHGLPRSNADKRRAVLTLLEDPEWSRWSDNVIAKKALVSQPFVSTLRRELQASQNVLSDRVKHTNVSMGEVYDSFAIEDLSGAEETSLQPEKRIGVDGVERDVSNIGRRRTANEVIPEEVDIPIDEPIKPEPIARTSEPQRTATATRAADARWEDGEVHFNIQMHAGNSSGRAMVVSGRHTKTQPIFRQYLARDLEPLPPALTSLLKEIRVAFEEQKDAPPPPPPAKKKVIARGKKKATKKAAKKPAKKQSRPPVKRSTKTNARKK